MSILRDNYSFNIYMLMLIDHQLCVIVLGPKNKIMKTDKNSSGLMLLMILRGGVIGGR